MAVERAQVLKRLIADGHLAAEVPLDAHRHRLGDLHAHSECVGGSEAVTVTLLEWLTTTPCARCGGVGSTAVGLLADYAAAAYGYLDALHGGSVPRGWDEAWRARSHRGHGDVLPLRFHWPDGALDGALGTLLEQGVAAAHQFAERARGVLDPSPLIEAVAAHGISLNVHVHEAEELVKWAAEKRLFSVGAPAESHCAPWFDFELRRVLSEGGSRLVVWALRDDLPACASYQTEAAALAWATGVRVGNVLVANLPDLAARGLSALVHGRGLGCASDSEHDQRVLETLATLWEDRPPADGNIDELLAIARRL